MRSTRNLPLASSRRRRALFALSALSAGLLTFSSAAMAADAPFPNKPIRFIVPYTAGGTTDLVARTVGAHMEKTLGQPVLIDNRGGAGGNIGMDAVARSAPDGYTIGMGAISTNALNPHIYPKMTFDPRKDFTAVGLLGASTIVLEVGPGLKVKNVAELLEHARKHSPTPFGTAGAGTSMHLAGVVFGQMSKTEWVHVPYKGSAPMLNDLLGGQIGVAFDNLPASLPHIKAGKLQALAVASAQRSPALPDVPTLAEAGLPGYAIEPWFGVYAPAGLPASLLQRLQSALQAAVNDPGVKQKLLDAGFTPRSSSAAELEALTRSEYERLGKVAQAAHMTLD